MLPGTMEEASERLKRCRASAIAVTRRKNKRALCDDV